MWDDNYDENENSQCIIYSTLHCFIKFSTPTSALHPSIMPIYSRIRGKEWWLNFIV